MFFGFAVRASAQACQQIFAHQILNPELEIYESAYDLQRPQRGIPHEREFGWKVLSRNDQGQANQVRIDLLVDNVGYDGQIAVIGPFNNWGKNLRVGDFLHPLKNEPQKFSGVIDGITHGMQYRILLNGQQVLDPSASMYTTREYAARENLTQQNGVYLNSIFYDSHDPRLYQTETNFVDVTTRPNLIGEVELHSLVAKYRSQKVGRLGPRSTADTYRFIAESGVVATLKDAGYTAIEMMPFNQSIDGDSWHLRYQVYGLFAPDSRYGSPSEFKMMIDEFHKNGVAVIMDSVISHFPFKGNMGERSLSGLGMDQWFKADGKRLFVGPMSPWDTYRYDYTNPFVRRFLVDSVASMMSEYKIDGIRMDNTDGILGTPGGSELLKELVISVRKVNPRALVVGEAFFPPNTLLQRTDQGGFGFNTRNDSNFFEIWKEGLGGSTEDLQLGSIGALLHHVFDWREVPMMRYLTNHDESANGRGGLTGGYPASLIGDDYYAFEKTKAADALNMLTGAYHLSLPQARMMQKGTFYSNPDIDWSLTESGRGQQLWQFFGALSRYVLYRSSYFAFDSLNREIENHIDNVNKVISIKRRDPQTGKVLYALINLGHHDLQQYSFGIEKNGSYRLAFDSEWSGFGGLGALQNSLSANGGVVRTDSQAEHGRPFSLYVPHVAPYSVTIFEEQ